MSVPVLLNYLIGTLWVIRKVYAAGRHRMKRLGEVFGVSASQICLIVNRRSRKAG